MTVENEKSPLHPLTTRLRAALAEGETLAVPEMLDRLRVMGESCERMQEEVLRMARSLCSVPTMGNQTAERVRPPLPAPPPNTQAGDKGAQEETEGELVTTPADDPLVVYVSPQAKVETASGGGCVLCGQRVAMTDGAKFARVCSGQGRGGVLRVFLSFVCFSCAQKHAGALFRAVIRGESTWAVPHTDLSPRCTRCRELGRDTVAEVEYGVAESRAGGLGMELCASHAAQFAAIADLYRKGGEVVAWEAGSAHPLLVAPIVAEG